MTRRLALMLAFLCAAPVRAGSADTAAAVQAAALEGDAEAQYRLGLSYAAGDAVEKDCGTAEAWFRRAAGQGHTGAQLALGALFADGCGVARNDVEAMRWYRRAAEGGSAEAFHHLGYMYYAGRGTRQSDEVAVKWLRRAVRQPAGIDPKAAADVYAAGRPAVAGLPKDDALVRFWLSVAEETGAGGGPPNLDAAPRPGGAAVRERAARLLEAWRRSPDLTLEDWVWLLPARPAGAEAHLAEAGPAAVAPLLAALEMADTRRFIWQICQVLSRMGPAAAPAGPALARLLGSRPTAEQLWIAVALARVDPGRASPAVPALERCLRDLPKDAPARDACASALAAVKAKVP